MLMSIDQITENFFCSLMVVTSLHFIFYIAIDNGMKRTQEDTIPLQMATDPLAMSLAADVKAITLPPTSARSYPGRMKRGACHRATRPLQSPQHHGHDR